MEQSPAPLRAVGDDDGMRSRRSRRATPSNDFVARFASRVKPNADRSAVRQYDNPARTN